MICPFAAKQLIAPGSNDPRIDPRLVIWHVAVSMAVSLFRFFRDLSGGIESHFYINWRGKIYQYRDTGWQADANYQANDFAISVETAGWAGGRWNLLQRKSMKRLSIWLRDEVGIPLEKAQTWDGTGHGYHIQFGSPGKWTPVSKSCPGPNRIKQFNEWFVPWMATADMEEEMSWAEKLTNFKSQGGETRKASNWFMRVVNTARRADEQSRESRNRARHIEATLKAHSEMLSTLVDRSLDESGRERRMKEIAKRLSEELDRMDAKEVAERLEIEVKDKGE